MNAMQAPWLCWSFVKRYCHKYPCLTFNHRKEVSHDHHQYSQLARSARRTAEEWFSPSGLQEDLTRLLKYRRFEFDGLKIQVEGLQWANGEVDHHVSLWANLTAANGKRIADMLREAADAIQQIAGTTTEL